MNIRNCRMCGRIFNYMAGAVVCPACRETVEAKFQEVKEYIREHRGAGIREVAEACDVDPGQIRQWLREDRLEVTEDSPMFLNCESCGAPIRSGKYCDKCKLDMSRSFTNVIKSSRPAPPPEKKAAAEDPNAKMRFLK